MELLQRRPRLSLASDLLGEQSSKLTQGPRFSVHSVITQQRRARREAPAGSEAATLKRSFSQPTTARALGRNRADAQCTQISETHLPSGLPSPMLLPHARPLARVGTLTMPRVRGPSRLPHHHWHTTNAYLITCVNSPASPATCWPVPLATFTHMTEVRADTPASPASSHNARTEMLAPRQSSSPAGSDDTGGGGAWQGSFFCTWTSCACAVARLVFQKTARSEWPEPASPSCL